MKPCGALTSTAVGRCEQGEAGFGRCAASAREGESGFADLAARPKPQSADTWRVRAPQRVTFGTTDEAAASTTSSGRMVFMSRTSGADIWSLPIDTDRPRPRGGLTRITQDLADDYDPSLSADGRTLAFRSRRAGRFDVFVRNLVTVVARQHPVDVLSSRRSSDSSFDVMLEGRRRN